MEEQNAHISERTRAIREMVRHPAWAIIVEKVAERVEKMQQAARDTMTNMKTSVDEIRYAAGRADESLEALEILKVIEEDAYKAAGD